jgi:hypothetical protein
MAFEYLHTGFENASPLDWSVASDGSVHVGLLYDHERGSPNRAAGHWHFQLQAAAGDEITLILANFDNVWNGRPGSPVSDRTSCHLSTDGNHWRAIEAPKIEGNRLLVRVPMERDSLYLARLEPYRLSDLERFLAEIREHPLVHVTAIGQSVEGRTLELIHVGRPDAPFRVLLRARSHPWEPGGNWVVQGLIRAMLREDAETRRFLDRFSLQVMPMAAKDGVVRGHTRFNLLGMDLNRNWERPADPVLAPENAALESWLESMQQSGTLPNLAIDLHNDNSGRLHICRPEVAMLSGGTGSLPAPQGGHPPPPLVRGGGKAGGEVDGEAHVTRMRRFEALLTQHTWFTEGSTVADAGAPMMFSGGLQSRYGIDACILELNCDWIAGLSRTPSGRDWELLGEQLRAVFYDYFGVPA